MVMSPETLHFSLYGAIQVVGEASSFLINRLVMSSLCMDGIVQIVILKLFLWLTNAQPYFILKVLEREGWGSDMQLIKPVHWPSG